MASRVQLALNVTDIDQAVDFYEKLFQTAPSKREPGYANFAIADTNAGLVSIRTRSGGTIGQSRSTVSTSKGSLSGRPGRR